MENAKKTLPPEQIALSLDECFCHCFKGCDDCAMIDRGPISEDCECGLTEMAIDLIRDQAKRIAELEAERRWIPVGEKLPEIGVPVLVCAGDRVDVNYREGDVLWGIDYDFKISHWMPLPTPPKEICVWDM